MVITLVMDQYGDKTNGTTATAMQLAEELRKRGHTVRIVTSVECAGEDNVYVVPKRKVPFFQKLIRSQGMELAYPDKEILREAITGADIVHFFVPFKLAKAGKEIADELGVASTAAFHVQPENITYSAHLGGVGIINKALYKWFESFYDKFGHIHCPSSMLADILDSFNYKAVKHVISNGISDYFVRTETDRPKEFDGKFLVMMSGRLSREKRQDLIIEAVARSKYKDSIGIIFCGKGPWKQSLQKLARKRLPADSQPIFEFCSREELRRRINYCDLYVHASDAEIEAISCMEAFACGLVPVISDSPVSATKQFALTRRNLFEAGNAESLKERIEYFIEHPEEKAALSEKYEIYAENFRLDRCIDEMVEMFDTAIAEGAARRLAMEDLRADKDYPRA